MDKDGKPVNPHWLPGTIYRRNFKSPPVKVFADFEKACEI